MRIRFAHVLVGALFMVYPARRATAQDTTTTTITTALVNPERSMVTRAALQASLDTMERLIGSPAYSSALKAAKRSEADVIRERLVDGDFHTGDIISIQVLGEPGVSALYQVSPDRTITIVGGEEISVKGILRSELQNYITRQLKVFIRDPVVKTTSAIRVSIFGAVAKPGFVQAPATALLSDVLMQSAGGVQNNMREDKSVIKRGDRVVVDGEQFRQALHSGMTLDQLNVEAGDEISVAAKPARGLFWTIVGGVSALTGIVYLLVYTHVL
ncbi:MAG: polysaccharide biosynthesis/export family protein [Gemmatimonadales bacterium]